jgi:rubrerythrin
MFINEVLDLAEELESGLSTCYRKLAELTRDEDISERLQRLAEEEINHRDLIKTGKSYLIQAPEVFRDVRMPADELREGLEQCESLAGRLEKASMDFPVGLEALAVLESTAERAHLSVLLELSDPELERLFQALAQGDAGHRLRLERLLSDLGLEVPPQISEE